VSPRPVYLYGRNGFGDAIYMRAVARAATRQPSVVYVGTGWPELFADLPVQLVRPKSNLYGPRVNVARYSSEIWKSVPKGTVTRRIAYPWAQIQTRGILGSMEALAQVRLVPFRFDLPPTGPPLTVATRVAVVRPVSLRADWPNPARNPAPEYVFRAAELLQEAGYPVVTVADLAPGVEEPLGLPLPADERYEHGELGMLELLAVVREAAIVVGGPGWIVPACVAAGTPLLVIGGGQGGCNGPDALLDPRMDTTRIRWLLPEPHCPCIAKRHDCPKVIPEFDRQFRKALQSLALRRAA